MNQWGRMGVANSPISTTLLHMTICLLQRTSLTKWEGSQVVSLYIIIY